MYVGKYIDTWLHRYIDNCINNQTTMYHVSGETSLHAAGPNRLTVLKAVIS